MLIDIGDNVISQEGLHMGSLLAVVLDRGSIETSFITALVTDFTGMLDIVYRLAEEPRRDPDDFLEVFFVSAGSTELKAIQARLHAIFDDIRVGETAICGKEHIWRFKVPFQPRDGGDKPLGIDKAFAYIERSNLDDASLAHFLRDTFKYFPIEIKRAIFAKLKSTEGAAIVAALRQLDFD